MFFEYLNKDKKSRAGLLCIKDYKIATPVFMPVGTQATVKAIRNDDMKKMGYKMILSNTYHLHLRPGDELICKMGGLHQFMNWQGVILTDSGGYQVFSLNKLNNITDEGVFFKSHLDGKQLFISPEKAVQIQKNLNSDIMMVLDECVEAQSNYDTTAYAVERTYQWAKRCLKEKGKSKQNLFGIIQGGLFEKLRDIACEQISSLLFEGYAVGGLSVGDPKEERWQILDHIVDKMPNEKPRYLMGVGDPIDILYAVESGIDMFDCVLPTRNARNGSLMTYNGYLSIKQKRFYDDPSPIEENCLCLTCQNYSRAYLRHLFCTKEILSSCLNSIHNLNFMYRFLYDIQKAILANEFSTFKNIFIQNFQSKNF